MRSSCHFGLKCVKDLSDTASGMTVPSRNSFAKSGEAAWADKSFERMVSGTLLSERSI